MCEQIRQRDGLAPVLIFSGYGYASDRAAGVGAGANAYIVKPAVGEIIPTVKRLLAQAPLREH